MSPHVATAVAQLRDMSVNQLADRYQAVFDEPCRSRNKPYLVRRIAWRLQANDEGGLSPAALERAARLASGADVRVTAPRTNGAATAMKTEPRTFQDWDPRLPPPHSMLERKYKGRTIRVMVLQDGFQYEGQHYGSLSAVAKAVNLLAPDIQEALLNLPPETEGKPLIHEKRLRPIAAMTDWSDQRAAWRRLLAKNWESEAASGGGARKNPQPE